MHVERYGSGPEVFFGLHGWNGDHRTFCPIVYELPENVSFWSADLPGCGQSPPPANWTLQAIASEIAHEIDRPVTLVGNCSGAVLALLVARSQPSLVRRLAIIDAFAAWPWYLRIFLARRIGHYAYLSAFANPMGRWMTNFSLRSKRKADTHLTRGFEKTDHRITYRYLELLGGARDASDFRSLAMPIDILYGERSFSAIRESARIWAGLWPQARTFELKGAGHLPVLEAAQQVRQILFGGDSCSTQQPDRLLSSAR